MPKIVLSSLGIKGYRGLRSLQIDQLAQVNLVVGKNNTGKSNLLEALRLYASRASIEVVRDLLISRDEVIGNPALNTTADVPSFLTFESLFSRPSPAAMGAMSIEIGPLDPHGEMLRIRLSFAEVNGQQEQLPLEVEEQPRRNRAALVVEFDGRRIAVMPLDDDLWYSGRRLPEGLRPRGGEEITAVYVPAAGMSNALTVRLYDSALLNGLDDDVTASLRIIDPTVGRLFFVDRQDPDDERLYRAYTPLGSRRVPMVQSSGDGRPVPLRSKGDGMNRIFGMVLALVNASNGMLLVDEVENGIHYSVQEEMWTLIMKIAERLNVQVFATSHSWDCVTAFERAAVRNRRVEGKLLRLERLGETVAATPFNERELEIAAEAGIEVR